MSLKGTNMLRSSKVREELRQKWEKRNADEQAQAEKTGKMLSPERERYEWFVCEEIQSIRDKAGEKQLMKLMRQRNILLVVCSLLLISTLFFAFHPTASGVQGSTREPADTETQSVEAERNYVASVNSDKYHRLSCDYAGNILAGNRIYYATAEEAGKKPCSVCRP